MKLKYIRPLALALCAVLLCSLFTACSGTSSSSEQPSSAASAASDSASASASTSDSALPDSTTQANTGSLNPGNFDENSAFSITGTTDAFAPCLGWGPGVSGCSLKSVIAAASLLQWAESAHLSSRTSEAIQDAFYDWYDSLSSADQENFAEAWTMIEPDALSLLSDKESMTDLITDAGLDPDTLLLPQTASMPVYAVSDPMGDGRDSLETLMGYLNISADASSFYSAGSEQVARSESDSLRLSQSGFATYEAGEARSGRFPVPVRGDQITLADAVDACRRLAAATVGSHCGQARLYLSGVTQQEDGLEVCFDYSLSGAPVQLSSGHAARFWVSQGQIVKFELSFRSYAKQAGTAALLPTRQAAAALAVEHPGHELLLVYRDAGGDTASADWAAAGTSSQEEG